MTSEDLVRAIERLESIPSPSFSLDRILELASDCESDIDRLAEAIEADPAVTVRVLRLANSAYFGVSGDVDGVARAIVVVGYKNVLSLAACAALAPAFQGDDPIVDRPALWLHSCAAAEAARIVAAHTEREPSIAHVAGLLHDFGLVVLSEVLRSQYAPVWAEARAGEHALSDLERNAFGLDHDAAAGVLFERWRLPARLVTGVVMARRPVEDATGTAAIVAIGAGLAARAGFAGPAECELDPTARVSAERALGLDEAALEKIAGELEARREAIELIAGGGPS